MSQDYYTILGLTPNATNRQVRERFLELARTRHPDRFTGSSKAEAEAEFQAITQAFNALNDPARRREIDAQLRNPTVPPQRDESQAAKVYLQRGIRAYRSKNYLEAAENFDRATKEDPSSARNWHHLAMACRHQKRWLSRARSAITKACELEPMNASYLRLAGRIFAESGMTARAEKYLKQALTWGGEDAEIHSALESLQRSGGKRIRLFGRS